MTREVKITLYKFDELNERAKESARDWWRAQVFTDSHDWEFVFEDACNIAELFGLNIRTRPVKLMSGATRHDPTIYFSGFSYQGSGASFEGSYEYKADALEKVKEYAPQDERLHNIVASLQQAQDNVNNALSCSITQHGSAVHSHTMRFEYDYDSEIEMENVTDEIRSESEEQIKEALRDFADWVYRALEREHEYQTDNEQVDENIRANGYEFNEDGDIA